MLSILSSLGDKTLSLWSTFIVPGFIYLSLLLLVKETIRKGSSPGEQREVFFLPCLPLRYQPGLLVFARSFPACFPVLSPLLSGNGQQRAGTILEQTSHQNFASLHVLFMVVLRNLSFWECGIYLRTMLSMTIFMPTFFPERVGKNHYVFSEH